ncbi:hypothetical protein IHV12_19925 [Fictibacillus sp. 7GRE50]|uniref:hypothetical protein n=1 Tax=Fictibacillus sp. 7GRE50 TaxID=2745878 RepID=UPI0018CF7A9F|nr:hypothetical protein [Fictibacillus sp. 7GRE50]MBH0167196.1 hypothetical protein [Fictibacillus sp. 7GRE50]
MRNQKSIISNLPIGTSLLIRTSDQSYGGTLIAMHSEWFVIKEANGLRFPINFQEVLWNSAE